MNLSRIVSNSSLRLSALNHPYKNDQGATSYGTPPPKADATPAASTRIAALFAAKRPTSDTPITNNSPKPPKGIDPSALHADDPAQGGASAKNDKRFNGSQHVSVARGATAGAVLGLLGGILVVGLTAPVSIPAAAAVIGGMVVGGAIIGGVSSIFS